MSRPDPLAVIERSRLLVIVRMADPDDEIAQALIDAGVEVVELSLAARGALAAIERWRARFPQLVTGAGTVIDPGQCTEAIAAGAEFLISPGMSPAVAGQAREAGVQYIPGALTPTEICACLDAGASVVKLFPAVTVGPGYVRQMLGPLPALKLLPTGGIEGSNARAFLAAGAAAVAVGSSVVRPGATYKSVLEDATKIVSVTAPSRQKGEA